MVLAHGCNLPTPLVRVDRSRPFYVVSSFAQNQGTDAYPTNRMQATFTTFDCCLQQQHILLARSESNPPPFPPALPPAQERGQDVGDEVGYQVRFATCMGPGLSALPNNTQGQTTYGGFTYRHPFGLFGC